MAEMAPSETPGDFRLGFAGDTFNTAWYLARLNSDVDVAYFTAVGDDAISQQMRAAFVAARIDDSHVQVVKISTVGLYMISLSDGERSFSYWRGQSAARQMMQDASALERAIADADLVYFSGITLAILDEPSRARLFAALGAARVAGKTIAFDPNLRPRLWSDTPVMTDAIMQGAAVSDIALPSFEDEATWFNDCDPEATADRYVAAGTTTVVVKNGPNPVFYHQDKRRGSVLVPPLNTVVDTTAAGDSFNAAILAGFMAKTDFTDSIRVACRVAGAVVQGKGALVPIELSLRA
ncbi:MAG: sugar kinase [Pacificibacter sp.]|uniref:sugar kinase n=1 Tax=Pacificibacter sp. TaxID=1917866 RepID=UPI00321C1EC3